MPDDQEELRTLRRDRRLDHPWTASSTAKSNSVVMVFARRQPERLANEFGLTELLNEPPEWSSSPLVRELVRCLLTVAGYIDGGPKHMTPAALRSLWHICFGIPSVRNGRAGMEALLAQKLSVTGGTIEDRRLVSRLDVRRKRVRTVETEDGAVFGTDAVIIAGGPSALAQLHDETTGSPHIRTGASARR